MLIQHYNFAVSTSIQLTRPLLVSVERMLILNNYPYTRERDEKKKYKNKSVHVCDNKVLAREKVVHVAISFYLEGKLKSFKNYINAVERENIHLLSFQRDWLFELILFYICEIMEVEKPQRHLRIVCSRCWITNISIIRK